MARRHTRRRAVRTAIPFSVLFFFLRTRTVRTRQLISIISSRIIRRADVSAPGQKTMNLNTTTISSSTPRVSNNNSCGRNNTAAPDPAKAPLCDLTPKGLVARDSRVPARNYNIHNNNNINVVDESVKYIHIAYVHIIIRVRRCVSTTFK